MTVLVLSIHVAAADPCKEAVACCEAAMTEMGQPKSQCAGITAGGPSACPQLRDAFVSALNAQHKKIPAACVAARTDTGGGGAPADGNAKAGDKAPAPKPSAGPKDQPPQPLPGENDKPADSTDKKISCLIDRVDGKRTVLTGDNETLEVKCSGMLDDSGALAKVPQKTARGGKVKVKWTMEPAIGAIGSQLFDRMTYNAPARVAGSNNEVTIHATVTVEGPGGARELAYPARTIHLVNKKLRLAVTGHIATHCTPGTGGSVTMEFEVECKQTIDLEIGKDFTVSSSNGKGCPSSAWKAMKSCAHAGTPSAPKAQWALRSAVGKVDPDSAVMSLQIEGDRVGWPDVAWPQKFEAAHTNALFPRDLTIGPDDNVMRVFGSMTDNATMGNQTTFELDAL